MTTHSPVSSQTNLPNRYAQLQQTVRPARRPVILHPILSTRCKQGQYLPLEGMGGESVLAPKWLWPAIIIASAAAVGGLVVIDLSSPIRTILALWFLVVCPGMALVRLLQLRNPWAEVALATAVSLSLDVGVSLGLAYSGHWSPNLGLAILIGVSLVGATLQLRIHSAASAQASSTSE
jgi:hypothetical protein